MGQARRDRRDRARGVGLKKPAGTGMALAHHGRFPHRPVHHFARRGDEIAGHGRTNSERQSQLAEAEERALIAEATDRIADHFGVRPSGWLGPT